MPKIKLNDTERVCGAALFLLGESALDTIYKVVNPGSKATPEAFHRQALRWRRGEQMQTYLEELASIHQDPITNNDPKDEAPLTKGYLIRELRNSLTNVKDAEARSKIVMRLADLANLKKEEDEAKKENRTYFLPWVSHCKTCKLMKIYQDELRKRKESNQDD